METRDDARRRCRGCGAVTKCACAPAHVADHSPCPEDAAAEAGASAAAHALAGLTVAISVTGLAFFGLDFVTKLGIGSALGVLTTVLIANSLLIAVLAKLGKSRGAGIDILFFVITLGFYGWVWAYRTQRKLKEAGVGPGGLLGLVLWVLLNPVSAFLIPAEIRQVYRRAGKESPVTPWTGLWLFPFGVLIVPAIIWFVKAPPCAHPPLGERAG